MRLCVVVVMTVASVVNCCANVAGGQDGEDEGLQESYQQFDQVHKGRKQTADDATCYGTAYTFTVVAKEEDQTDQAQDDDVACRDVGKQTYHQGERLNDQAQYFYRGQYNFDPSRNAWHPEDVLPVVLIAAEVGDQEGQHRQHQRHRQVARYVGTPREEGNQAQQVAEQDEEEQRHNKRLETLIVLLADHRTRNFIADENKDGLYEGLQAAGCLTRVALVRSRYRQKHDEQQDRGQHHGGYILGDRKIVEGGDATAQHTSVEGAGFVQFISFALVRGIVYVYFFLFAFHQLHFLFVLNAVDVHFAHGEAGVGNAVYASVVEYVAVNSGVAMLKHAGRARRPAMTRCIKKTRKWNVYSLPNMEFVGVGDVVHYRAYRIVGTLVVVSVVGMLSVISLLSVLAVIHLSMVVLAVVMLILTNQISRRKRQCDTDSESLD